MPKPADSYKDCFMTFSNPLDLFLTPLDQVAIVWFLLLSIIYSWWVEHGPTHEKTLSAYMNAQRENWLRETLRRDHRIVDATIITGLQNGTAFFASASLLAIGGCFGLLRASDEIFTALQELPVGVTGDLHQLEMKLFGLALIFAYAFFKFGWSFRLLNYNAILIGAIPPLEHFGTEDGEKAVQKALAMSQNAGKHFNRGLRTFFFALGFIGWFIGPLYFMVATTWITLVLYRRQFYSSSLRGINK